jgi:aminoglycoside 6'-N-acetyltransferase
MEEGPSAPLAVEVRDEAHRYVGAVRPGEPWAAAAARVAGMPVVAPVPVDLSGTTKRFQVDRDLRVTLREMTRGDLRDVTRWRAQRHVARWWSGDGEPTYDVVAAKYGPRIDGRSPTRMWVLDVNGRSVGFGQDYRIGDYPDYAVLGPDPEAIGVDYAIGEPEWAGRGLGVRMLWAWATQVRRRHPAATTGFAAPDYRNAASLRILAKTGFTEGLWFDEPNGEGGVDTVVGCSLDLASVVG